MTPENAWVYAILPFITMALLTAGFVIAYRQRSAARRAGLALPAPEIVVGAGHDPHRGLWEPAGVGLDLGRGRERVVLARQQQHGPPERAEVGRVGQRRE